MTYFIKPPLEMYAKADVDYYQASKTKRKTYAEYNYLRPGIASFIKSRHFEVALKLTLQYFHHCKVIDFGCADGVFLPSLSKYFEAVCGIDKNQSFIDIAHALVDKLALNNVKLICNQTISISDIKGQIAADKYQVLFLLETLEHIGRKEALYESKVDFIEELFSLIDKNGILVISVPKMIGISFLIQRLGLALLRLYRSPMWIRDIFRASFLNDSSNLEKQWAGEHEGFNHKKLEDHLAKRFDILKKSNMLFQVVYVVKRNPAKHANY